MSLNVDYKKNEEHQGEFSLTVPAEEVAKIYQKTLQDIQNNTKLTGFRKGKAPLKLVVGAVGEGKIKLETIENLLSEYYPKALKSQPDLEFIGNPDFDFNFEDFAPDKDFSFKLILNLKPTAKVCAYKKLKVKYQEPKVKKEEIEKELDNLKENLAKIEKKEVEEITPALIKKYTKFENLEELEENIKNDLKQVKQRESISLLTQDILEALADKSDISYPPLLIEHEQESIQRDFENQLARYNLNLQMYLKRQEKKMEDLEKEWKKQAQKTVESNIVLDEIAEKEEISITEQDLKQEVNRYLYPHVNRKGKLAPSGEKVKKSLESPNGQAYLKIRVRRKKTLNFLLDIYLPEELKIKKSAPQKAKKEEK